MKKDLTLNKQEQDTFNNWLKSQAVPVSGRISRIWKKDGGDYRFVTVTHTPRKSGFAMTTNVDICVGASYVDIELLEEQFVKIYFQTKIGKEGGRLNEAIAIVTEDIGNMEAQPPADVI